MPDNTITKYLARYAEPEASLTLPEHRYDFAVVIPAHNESHSQLREVWRDIPATTNFLVILVVNSPDENSEADTATVREFTKGQSVVTLYDNIQLVTTDHPHLLIVDRYSQGRTIPARQGVGLARKIGMDIATRLAHETVVASNWLFTTDADVQLPANYFAVRPERTDAALVYPFMHIAPEERTLAMQLYEVSLLYYVAGLRWAGSPYAYPTIGSIISCAATSYATVRGFPKRNTGEDFYLLNKLRKTGAVRTIDHAPVRISGRASERVPIGTGQAVTRISRLDSPLEDFTVEHPDCFTALRTFLAWITDLSANQPNSLLAPYPALATYLESTGFPDHYEKKRLQNPSARIMSKHLHDWFDGLKTRQFIHHFRDQHFGAVTVTELPKVPFLAGETSLEGITASLRAYIYHQQPL